MKRCTECGERLPATPEWFFRYRARRSDGLKAACKACDMTRTRLRREEQRRD